MYTRIVGVTLSLLLGGSTVLPAQDSAGADELIALPEICQDGEVSVERAMSKRRSVRDFADVSLS